ncbi:MAG: DUF6456 domain-containing protein [Hyphomicrobiaceae bacterium]
MSAARGKAPAPDPNRPLIACLRQLAAPDAYLDPGDARAGRPALIHGPARRGASGIREIEHADCERLIGNGLVECRDGRWKLSRAGVLFLKRRLAGGEDPHRAQHQALKVSRVEMAEGGRAQQTVTIDEAESPLAWLRSRRDKSGRPMLSDAQFTAGERLRAEFWFAQMTPRVTTNWSAFEGGGRGSGPSAAGHVRDEVLAARTRVTRALTAVGPELAGVLIDVCCHLKGIEAVEEAEGWPQRSGKVLLLMALTRLARHWGYERGDEAEASIRARLVHWGADDYRPTVDRPE